MTTSHPTKSRFGKYLKFETKGDAIDYRDPLCITLGDTNGLVTRADAIVLRDMLVERLGLPEAPAPKATTSKLGEPVEFTASNGYSISDRSPYALIVRDAKGEERYRVGKYTVAALREYFDRPYVAPAPTIRQQVDALNLGARFKVPESGGATYTKVAQGWVSSDILAKPVLVDLDQACPVWSENTDTIEVVD